MKILPLLSEVVLKKSAFYAPRRPSSLDIGPLNFLFLSRYTVLKENFVGSAQHKMLLRDVFVGSLFSVLQSNQTDRAL